jgi:cardiolipin synthase
MLVRRGSVVGSVLLAIVVLLAGCAGVPSPAVLGPQPATAVAAANATTGSCAAVACAARQVQVFVEPDAGEAPVLQAIAGAASSVWVEVYLLTDRNVIHALEDAAARGVDVRVLLETHPYGGGATAAQQLLEELSAAGVQARSADPAYHYTHEKAMVVDGKTTYILTGNLSRSALGGSSAGANREYGVIDTNPEDVAGVSALFQADWNRTTPALHDPTLVVSPINARATLAGLIAQAHTSLYVEDEEMYDQRSEEALIAAARRGVSVEVVLPESSAASEAADVARLAQGGVQVRYLRDPYPHAKLMLVDGQLAFVGSENFSSTSLDENRELGIVLADPQALGILRTVFGQDWALAVAA